MKKIAKILIIGFLGVAIFASTPVDARGHGSDKSVGRSRNRIEDCVNQTASRIERSADIIDTKSVRRGGNIDRDFNQVGVTDRQRLQDGSCGNVDCPQRESGAPERQYFRQQEVQSTEPQRSETKDFSRCGRSDGGSRQRRLDCVYSTNQVE